jgi:hypothetical protein
VTDPKPSDAPAVDQWSKWFNALLQFTGWGIIVEQVIVGQDGHDRPWILLIAIAMILGGAGLRLLLRGALRMLGGGS